MGGRDMFWPPTAPENATLEDVVRGSMSFCDGFKKLGFYGLPDSIDEQGQWLDTLYGGTNIGMHTNIFFSNGGLDPWASAGVMPPGPSEKLPAALIPMAGHHLDLFFPTDADSVDLRRVRSLERSSILSWIVEARQRHQSRVKKGAWASASIALTTYSAPWATVISTISGVLVMSGVSLVMLLGLFFKI